MSVEKTREVRVVTSRDHRHHTIAIPHEDPLKHQDTPLPDPKNVIKSDLDEAKKVMKAKKTILVKLKAKYLTPTLCVVYGCPNQFASKCAGTLYSR
jgi:hypothetical protein